MNFIIYFVLTVVAFGVVGYGGYFLVKRKLKKSLGDSNFNELWDVMKNVKDMEREEYERPKSVSGMTKLLEPIILRDFPDFNKEVLYQKVEDNLNGIFRALEKKDLTELEKKEDFILLENGIKEKIEDLKEQDITLSFSGVDFHGHAIKAYDKKEGMATITISSALEYFYQNSKMKNEFANVKKQTRYVTKFVYVYDESKVGGEDAVLVIRCPNCGAPLRGLGKIRCTYCGSDVDPINLKAWKMVEYKEDCGY